MTKYCIIKLLLLYYIDRLNLGSHSETRCEILNPSYSGAKRIKIDKKRFLSFYFTGGFKSVNFLMILVKRTKAFFLLAIFNMKLLFFGSSNHFWKIFAQLNQFLVVASFENIIFIYFKPHQDVQSFALF